MTSSVHRRTTTMAVAAATTLILLIITAITSTATTGPPLVLHNITAILSSYPQFSTFNHHLTTTGLSAFINNLTDVTVCAVDNSAMSDLLSLNPSPASLKRILTSHLFSTYFDEQSLRQYCCAWSFYPRPSGATYEVLDLIGAGSNFSFAVPYSGDRSDFIAVAETIDARSRLSVIHVSTILPSPEAESLRRPIDLFKVFSGAGCGLFAGAVAGVREAERLYRETVYGGLTVICPIDEAFEDNLSRFGSLREEEKISVLLYHALPVYYNEIEMRGLDDSASLWSYYGGGGAAAAAAMLDMVAVEKLLVDGAACDRAPLAVYPIKAVLFPGDREKVEELAPVVHAVADSI